MALTWPCFYRFCFATYQDKENLKDRNDIPCRLCFALAYLFVCLFVFSFVDLFYTPNTIPQARLHLLFFNPTIPSLSLPLTLKFLCVSILPPSRLSPCYLHHNPPVSFYSVFYHLLNLPYKLELIYVHIGTFYHLSFIFVLTIPPSQFSPCHLTTIP